MIPLAILGALIYYPLYEILVYLNANNYSDSDPDQWGHWIDSPSEAKGAVGDILQKLDCILARGLVIGAQSFN